MKTLSSFLVVALLGVLATFAQAQNVGINTTGASPNESAMLDISADNKGLLIPRVALTSINDIITVMNPETSLLIYNTETATWVTPGFYYWSNQWTRIASGTIPIADGGTGATDAGAAINALLPTQTSNNGKYLTTDGSAPIWGDLTSSQWTTTNSDIYYNTGNVGIGTTSPSYTLTVNGSVYGAANYITSDARLKKDVSSLENGLSKIMALHPINFNWNKTVNPELKLDDRNHLGFLAQELETVLPQVVSTADDAMKTKSVAYSDIVPVLTKAIQEQQATIEAQQKQIDELKKMVEGLMKK